MKLPWKKNSSTLVKLIISLTLVCLSFSVTNVVPFSASLALLLIFLPFFLYFSKTQHFTFVSLFILLGYFVVSTLIYCPESFIYFSFYRRDGNVFITYAPLLILPFFKLNIDLNSIVRKFIISSSVVNLIFLVIYGITGGTLLFEEPGVYNFLFEAHNAAGGFLATLSAFSVGFCLHKKDYLLLILSLSNVVGLYLTDSRGSILAFLVSSVIVLVMRGRFFKLIVAIVIVFQVSLLSWFYLHAPTDFLVSTSLSAKGYALEGLNRSDTLLIRGYYLWPRAIYLFLHSPFFGTGFGSYNDTPYSLEGVAYFFQLNFPNTFMYSDAHAHHTFLHVLAETGALGLFLLFYFLGRIRKFILSIKSEDLKVSLYLTFWVDIISSLTEHRLFTPSQMLPFTIILGLAIAKSRYDKSLFRQLTSSLALN